MAERKLPVVYVVLFSNGELFGCSLKEPAGPIRNTVTVPYEPAVPRCKTCKWFQNANCMHPRGGMLKPQFDGESHCSDHELDAKRGGEGG